MPDNHEYHIDGILSSISDARINSYIDLGFDANSDKLVHAYFSLQELSSHFFVPLQVLEISLRNAIHSNLTLRYKRINGDSGKKWYDIINLTDESRRLKNKAIKDLRERKKENFCENDIISKLSFGFWVRLMDKNFRNGDKNHPEYQHNFWQYEHQNIFPNKGKLKMNNIHSEFTAINSLRNRLFHQEPIWKGNKSKSYSSAIECMKAKYEKVMTAIFWISEDKKLYMEREFSFKDNFQKCCDFYLAKGW